MKNDMKIKKYFFLLLIVINSTSAHAGDSWLSSLGSAIKNAGDSLYKSIACLSFYRKNRSFPHNNSNNHKEKIAGMTAAVTGTGLACLAGWYYFFKKPAIEQIKNELHGLEAKRENNQNLCKHLQNYQKYLQKKLDILVPPVGQMLVKTEYDNKDENYLSRVKSNTETNQLYTDIEEIKQELDDLHQNDLNLQYNKLGDKNYTPLETPLILKHSSMRDTLLRSQNISQEMHQTELIDLAINIHQSKIANLLTNIPH